MDAFIRPAEEPADRRKRGLSQEVESYAALKAQRGHRRIVSNNTMDLHRVLANSPPIESPLRPSIDNRETDAKPQTPDSLCNSEHSPLEKDSIEDAPPLQTAPRAAEGKKSKRSSAFMGMLEAAIMYFAEDRPIRPSVAYNVQEEVLSVRTTITGLKERLLELETDNEAVGKQKQKLLAQQEHYEKHVAALNKRLEDLQVLADTQSTLQLAPVSGSEDSLEDGDSRPRPSDASSRPSLRPVAKPGPKKPPQRAKVKVNSAIYFS